MAPIDEHLHTYMLSWYSANNPMWNKIRKDAATMNEYLSDYQRYVEDDGAMMFDYYQTDKKESQ